MRLPAGNRCQVLLRPLLRRDACRASTRLQAQDRADKVEPLPWLGKAGARSGRQSLAPAPPGLPRQATSPPERPRAPREPPGMRATSAGSRSVGAAGICCSRGTVPSCWLVFQSGKIPEYREMGPRGERNPALQPPAAAWKWTTPASGPRSSFWGESETSETWRAGKG